MNMEAKMPAVNAIDTAINGFEPLLTIDEVAAVLRRTHWTLRADLKAGRIRAIRVGKRIVFEPAEVRRILEAARQAQDLRHEVRPDTSEKVEP
jgi:excisionase family DNA binding protein